MKSCPIDLKDFVRHLWLADSVKRMDLTPFIEMFPDSREDEYVREAERELDEYVYLSDKPFFYYNTLLSDLKTRDDKLLLTEKHNSLCDGKGPVLTENLELSKIISINSKGLPVSIAITTSSPEIRKQHILSDDIYDISYEELIRYPELIDLVEMIDKDNIDIQDRIYSAFFGSPILKDLENYWIQSSQETIDNLLGKTMKIIEEEEGMSKEEIIDESLSYIFGSTPLSVTIALEQLKKDKKIPYMSKEWRDAFEQREKLIKKEVREFADYEKGLWKKKILDEQKCLSMSEELNNCRYEDRELGSFSLEWLSEKGKIPSYALLPFAEEFLKKYKKNVYYSEPLLVSSKSIDHVCVPSTTEKQSFLKSISKQDLPERLKKMFSSSVFTFDECRMLENTYQSNDFNKV